MVEKILSLIGSGARVAVELETLLTSVPAMSPDSGGDGELAKCRALEAWLRARGLDALERHDAPDPRAAEGVRPNLVATIRGKDSGGGRLWIMSHLDVVPPGDLSKWESDPWTVVEKDGRIYGRGVEDNQQGLVSSVLAALALKDSGAVPPRDVKLLFVADEEVGSDFGIQWLLANRDLFRADDVVLIPDGGDEHGVTAVVAEKKVLWLRFGVKGVQCHASRPDQGSNAHVGAAELAVRLRDELYAAHPDRDPLFEPDRSTFEPTKKEANVPNVNTIPGEDVFYMDMRVLPRHDLDAILDRIGRIAKEVEAKRGVAVDVGVVQRTESLPTAADAPVVGLLAGAVKKVYGVDVRPIGIGGGTVGAYLRNAGIDSVVWSRVHESAHQPNEFAVVDHILGDAKVMALMMMEERR